MFFNNISVDPGVPQALLADQIASDSGTFIIHLFWSLPSNISPDDIAHFIVHIDGIHVANETRSVNENSFMAVYHLCSCGSHSISVSAVNRCGRSGNSISIVIEDQLSIPQLTMECQRNTTTTGRNLSLCCICMCIYSSTHTHTHMCNATLVRDALTVPVGRLTRIHEGSQDPERAPKCSVLPLPALSLSNCRY